MGGAWLVKAVAALGVGEAEVGSIVSTSRSVVRSFASAAVSSALVALPSVAAADAERKTPTESPTGTATADGAPADEASGESPTEKPRETSFAVVPGPFYNPNLGLGLNVIPMVMFHPDKDDAVSPPSLALMNLLYAVKPPFDDEAKSRQSFFVSAASRLFLDEDRWRVVGMAAYINLFQEFYGVGGDVDHSNPLFDYRLEQVIAIGQVFRQVGWKGFYLGGLLGLVGFHTKTDNPEDEAVMEALGSGADWRVQPNAGVLSQYDTRNNKYYPSQGVNFNLRMNGSFKSEEEYLLVAPGFNQYFPLLRRTEHLVLAYRVFGQFGFGNLPIAAYAHYGMRGTTLGYESGEYIDKKMGGVEAELRWLAWWRLGFEAGGGVGKVFGEFEDFPDAEWLPGVWGSGTFKVMEKQDIRARATVAYGKSGVLFYFTVGQNF